MPTTFNNDDVVYRRNNVMKFLTSVTILITIPTLVSSIYGMNVTLPFAENPYAFYLVIAIAIIVSIIPVYFLYKRKMF
jgi:magnesium transporter